MLNKDLINILACPQCKGRILLTATEDGLYCEACQLLYPIRDDIPIMLKDEAMTLPQPPEILA